MVSGGDCGCMGHYFGRVGVGGKIFWLGGGGLRRMGVSAGGYTV